MSDKRILLFLFIPLLILNSSWSFHENNSQNLSSDHPNIIVIFCDDLGYGDLEVYGHPTIRTPNLNRMAAEGLKFSSFYSASPACTASRYSLLTGRYPIMSGFGWVLNPSSERGIHPEEITMAEALKESGYATAMYGKWHLGTTKREYLPLQNGFDEFIGFPYSNDMLPPKWPEIALLQNNDTLEISPDQSKLTALYTEKAVEFIQRDREEPFFLYVAYAMPHVPLHPGKAFAGKSKRGKYGDVVEEIDWSVGEILKTLQDQGLDENTLVWFTSDNGPWLIKEERGGSAGLLRDGKGSTWEGGMREPAIAWWPGKIKAGRVSNQLTHTMDIYATNLTLADAEVPNDRLLTGRNISGLLLADESYELVDTSPFFYYGHDNTIFAVRKGSWKLHIKTYSQLGLDYFSDEMPLLFNVETDPSEKYNIAKGHPEKVKELLQAIETQNQQVLENPGFYAQADK